MQAIYCSCSGVANSSLGPRPKPTPARITSSGMHGEGVHATGSDPHWGWFGSGAETISKQKLQSYWGTGNTDTTLPTNTVCRHYTCTPVVVAAAYPFLAARWSAVMPTLS